MSATPKENFEMTRRTLPALASGKMLLVSGAGAGAGTGSGGAGGGIIAAGVAGAVLTGFSTFSGAAFSGKNILRLWQRKKMFVPLGAGFFGAGGTGTHSLSFSR